MKNSQINVCSSSVMILKFYVFSAVMHSSRWEGVFIVLGVATLTMSCYVVREITTRSVPQRYADYLWMSQPLVAL